MTREQIQTWFQNLQDNICVSLEQLDGKATFQEDLWERDGGGGGRTRIMQQGRVIEKGGVNFSAVHGHLSDKMWQQLHLTSSSDFYATGVSIVIHPSNPLMPIIHMNVRYFEMGNGQYWFGGGIDLTPHYVFPEDAHFFHTSLKNACDKHDPNYYPQFKKWADDYFYIKHRQETRGIGGIFFNQLTADEQTTKAQRFDFVKEVGNSFVPIYQYFIQKHAHKNYTEANKKWQMLRRSRYAEFNLVYDLGTKFGLDTNGRIESIFMSMPPSTGWKYNFKAAPNSAEAKTLSLLKKEIDWASLVPSKVKA